MAWNENRTKKIEVIQRFQHDPTNKGKVECKSGNRLIKFKLGPTTHVIYLQWKLTTLHKQVATPSDSSSVVGQNLIQMELNTDAHTGIMLIISTL